MNDWGNQLTTGRRREPLVQHIATAHLRQPPDFVIIGAQRGGTTSLYRYLTEHPDVGPSLRKEIHFFDSSFEKGLDWYLAHFPLRGTSRLAGEASPSYLFAPAVPERIQATLPSARYIALLRNPVDRAFSHYQLMVRRGIESLSFEAAIAAEDERLAGSGHPFTMAWRHFSYLRRGLYADQLGRWLAFVPRDRLLIIESEHFFADPATGFRQTLDWLGLAPWTPEHLTVHQVGAYAELDPAVGERLRVYFEPHNRRLYDLLGRDFSWGPR